MSIGAGREPEPGAGGSLIGALMILVGGLALGVAFNAFGMASRPPRGLVWIAQPQKIASLETLQSSPAPAGLTDAADGSAHGVEAVATPDDESSRQARAVLRTGSEAAAPPPNPAPAAGAPIEPSGTDARAATPPAGANDRTPRPKDPAPAPGAQETPPAPAADLPAIPDADQPLTIELPTFKKFHAARAALVVDAREAEEYAAGRIPGAIHLSYNDALAEPERVKRLDPGGRPIVVYCISATCDLAANLARVLIESGKRKVLVYEAGFTGWKEAGLPVERGPSGGGKP